MMRPVVKGSVDQSVVIRIVDSTDGTPETGVVYNTSGIDLWYRRESATKTSITEATLTNLNDAHSDGGVLHIGDGYYRIDLPDAAVATGVNGVMVGGTVTGMVVIGCYVPLWDVSPYDVVRMGMTALPNVAQGNAGQLPTATSAGLVTLAAVTHTGAVVPTVTTLTGHTAQTGDTYARLGAPAGASVSADVAAVKTDTGNLATRITSGLFTGITSMAQWLGLIAGKQVGNSTARTELRATGAGSGTYDETTDSQEALKDGSMTAADLETSVQNVVEDNHLDHLLAVDYDPASKPGVATALLNELIESDSGVSRYTANALEQAPSGTGASAASIRAEMDSNSTQLAKLGTPAGASISADLAALQANTDNIQTRIPTSLVSGRMDSSVGAMAANTMTAAAAASDLTTELQTGLATSSALSTAQGNITTILGQTGTTGVVVADKTGFRLSSTGVADISRTAMTEAYAADGSAPTMEQLMYMIWAALSEFSISGTTITAKKLDGSTTAMTFTLDSSTAPTSRTRAT